jgi:hypothetical protein
MKQRGLPFVDLIEAHRADFALYKGDIKDYLAKFWVGHYNPLGNQFCAFALLPKLVELLEPKPRSYRPETAAMK